jgi:hypothetical protein
MHGVKEMRLAFLELLSADVQKHFVARVEAQPLPDPSPSFDSRLSEARGVAPPFDYRHAFRRDAEARDRRRFDGLADRVEVIRQAPSRPPVQPPGGQESRPPNPRVATARGRPGRVHETREHGRRQARRGQAANQV